MTTCGIPLPGGSFARPGLDAPHGRAADPGEAVPEDSLPELRDEPPRDASTELPPAPRPPRRQAGPFRCVMCGGPVRRVRRRLVDRLISIVRPSWRFRCMSRACGWEGRGPQGHY
jgi:hypothetical protein